MRNIIRLGVARSTDYQSLLTPDEDNFLNMIAHSDIKHCILSGISIFLVFDHFPHPKFSKELSCCERVYNPKHSVIHHQFNR